MKWFLTALLTISLAFPAGRIVQLCKHESGPVHLFAGILCDGTLSHGQDSHGHAHHGGHNHGHHHDHGHDHSGTHSDHSSPGEHHEPCTHETIATGDDLAKAKSMFIVTPEHAATLLLVEQRIFTVGIPGSVFLFRKTQTRGPPGLEDPLRQFATCVRLTV